jgi:branched-chain amino acid transport system substrate-binding protein
MLEETWLSGLSYPFDKIKGAVTWSGELDNEMNKTFISRAKQHLSIFSMISWEAGQFISKAAEYIEENERDVKAASPQIENINFFSPRGNIKFHKRTHYQQTSFYWTEIVKDETTGNCKLKILNEISFTDSDFEDFITDTPTGIFSKWTNTYLCI